MDTSVSEIRRITGICLAANLLLAVLKGAAGIAGSSRAMTADALHTLADSVTDIAILAGAARWTKPPDQGHPYGHRRIETVITLFIGAVLVLVAAGTGYTALQSLRGMHAVRPGWIAFAAGILSICAKEILYRWSAAAGRRIGSSAVVANAWHHRSDALSSVPAALAVAGAAVNPSWWLLDSVGAVVVSLFILKAAWDIGFPALQQLVDAGTSAENVFRIKSLALETPGVADVHRIRTRSAGSGLHVDLHVLVDPLISVRDGHSIAGEVRQRIMAEGPGVIDAVIHIEPFENPGTRG